MEYIYYPHYNFKGETFCFFATKEDKLPLSNLSEIIQWNK